ncbi:MAG: hypothetical protein IJ012_00220 [Clostridia bacterium]|nr:hypothetical protein [Clostridia bacterium]
MRWPFLGHFLLGVFIFLLVVILCFLFLPVGAEGEGDPLGLTNKAVSLFYHPSF